MSEAGAIAPMEAFDGGWVEEKIAKRQESVRMRLLREMHGRHKAKRARRKLVAQAALIASMMMLSLTVVEIARRAHHMWFASQNVELAYHR